MLYKQPDGHNCAVYALANVFCDPTFLAHIVYGSGEPTRIYDQNEILKIEKKGYHIECIWRDFIKNRLPTYFDLIPVDNSHILPMLMVISDANDTIRHCVGIHVMWDGKLYILDSLKDEKYETNWISIHDYAPLIHGLYVFVDNITSEYIILL